LFISKTLSPYHPAVKQGTKKSLSYLREIIIRIITKAVQVGMAFYLSAAAHQRHEMQNTLFQS
jgi:ABC-type uncharacterized transport system permease subunit